MANQRPIEFEEDMLPETVAFLQSFHMFISGMYGDRCPERAHGCENCRIWALYDLTETMVGIRTSNEPGI